ncbi:M23 family metallopeptidase [Gulosibacter chungangensis]|uniref:Peptidoglycan DD-metalloendopeptidase family protein n=1 Tax=Gulosibacter chungangensis TaxID=979746 RepID=A0A7J5BET0_9MICO|nr:M23 family metallopeptidase [Gulosibacter chungangensis]KAB1644744.1 peptidoglycan DD-metalloendopeptidase family protein [Gulosibacter chungangensis]
MSPKHAATPTIGERKRRQVLRLATASVVVAGLLTTAGAYLANPSTDPAAIDLIPTADPSFSQPTDTIEPVTGGQGGGVTPDSAFGPTSIRTGESGQAANPNSAALNGATNQKAQQAVQWPLASGDKNITSGFGPRVSPCAGCSSNHRGLDFAGAVGTPVGSISAGIVIDVSRVDNGGLGVHVVVEHRIDGKVTRSVYAHLLTGSLTVKPGDVVLAGEKIGELGNTGSSTGPHLHLEIVVQGTHVDPYTFLKKYADDEDIDVIDRPAVDWAEDQDPDAEGEGWTPNKDTLKLDPAELSNVDPKAPGQTAEPTVTESDDPTEGTAPSESTAPTTTQDPEATTDPEPTETGGETSGPGSASPEADPSQTREPTETKQSGE